MVGTTTPTKGATMSTFLRRRVPLTVLLAVVGLLSAGAVALAVTTLGGGGTVTRIYANGSNSATTTQSTAFVPIPFATRIIPVPAGETALVVARFGGESQ